MKKTCNVIGCNGEHKAQGLCNKHYKQFQKGTFTGPISKSFVSRQEGYATVVVPYDDGNAIVYFDIDLEDAKEIEKYDWHYDKKYDYCYHDSKTGRFLLHRTLMNVKEKQIRVYFKDNNRFNCRKDNLIVVLPTERTEYENDRDAFIAKKEQQNNKSYGSTPVIEKQNYTDILKTDDGKYVMVSENKQCTIFTKEEIESKILELFNSDPTRFLELFE